MTDEPAGVVTSTAQDELRSVLIFTSYIGATYWIPVSDEMSHFKLSQIRIYTSHLYFIAKKLHEALIFVLLC